MSAFSTLIPVTVVSPASTLYLGTSQIVKVLTSGSGAAIYYYDNGGSLERVVVSETPAQIYTAAQTVVALTLTGGTVYINANLIISVVTDGGTGSYVMYNNPEAATQEVYEASESPSTIRTAVAAIVSSGGGSVTTGLTAFAGGGQGSATQLSFGYNEVTTVATAGDSVKLQPAQAGAVITVLNDGANAMDVFPYASDTINDAAVNIAISVSPGNTVVFTAITGVNWESSGQTIRTGSVIVTGTTDSTSKDTGSITTDGGVGIEKSVFIGEEIILEKEVDHLIYVPISTTTNADGGALRITCGYGVGTGAGGQGRYRAGAGGVTGEGGSMLVMSGDGGATSGNSGTLDIATGDSNVGYAGALTISTGNVSNGQGGNIILRTGTHTSTTLANFISLQRAVVKFPLATSVASGGSITAVQLVGGVITGTGATGNWALPTAAQITTALGGSTPAGTNFDFIFNAQGMTATNVATLTVGAGMTVMSAPAITGGAALTIAQDTQSVGVFKIVFDTTTTCKISRIA